jgi:hypothetical protein
MSVSCREWNYLRLSWPCISFFESWIGFIGLFALFADVSEEMGEFKNLDIYMR